MQPKIPSTEGELIKSGKIVRTHNSVQNLDDLLDKKIFKELVPGSGHYAILPKGTSILNSLYDLLDDYIASPMCFTEITLPKMAPLETFVRSDTVKKWDSYLLSVTPFTETKGVAQQYLLDPLQCTVLYQLLQGSKLDTDQPIRYLDRSGPTYRNEDMDKIRVGRKHREFHRSEFMYIGTKEQVIGTRENAIQQLENLCDDLGLRYRIVVGCGCYEWQEGEMPLPQKKEEIPIKDLEVYIPQTDSWLEIAGASVLGSTMTRRFDIKGKNEEELWSGCMGIGMERLLYAFIAYHGTDTQIVQTKKEASR